MDIIDFYDFIDRVAELPPLLLLLGGVLLVGVFLLLIGTILGRFRRKRPANFINTTNSTPISTQSSPLQSGSLPEVTDAEAAQIMASLAMLPPVGLSVVSVYRVVQDKKSSSPIGVGDPERLLITLSPPSDSSITITINSQMVKEQRSSGIAEVIFPEEGQVELAVSVSGAIVSDWKTTVQVGKGSGAQLAAQAASVQLALSKTDGTSSSVAYRSDYYYVQIYPNYQLKVNIYTDDTFYMRVEGSEYFSCQFTDAGEHTIYASLEDNPKNATGYLYVTVYEG